MPATSPAQERLMQAAAHTKGGFGGVPQSVGKEFTKDSAPNTNTFGSLAGSIRTALRDDAEFNESDHRRDEDGKFSSGGSSLYSHLASHEDKGTLKAEVARLVKEQPGLHDQIKESLRDMGYTPESVHPFLVGNKQPPKKQTFAPANDAPEGNVDESFGEYEWTSPRSIEPPHEVRDKKKLTDLAKKMEKEGWQGRPILAIDLGRGQEALTGSHRIAAAKIAGIDVPVVMVDEDIANYEDENGKNIRDMMYEEADVMAAFLKKGGDTNASNLTMAEHEEQENGYWRHDSIGAAQPQGITELDIAKSIQSGELASPQQYENIWLFDVRITGTGTAYRQALDEYVYRPPEHFLSEEFVQRCNGLPIIFEHPGKGILNTNEYRERAIGTVVLPYIKGDEVWGVAKIYDVDAAALMRDSHASTSPAVVFRDAGSTESVDIGDGKHLLIEGKPSYLDHLAICEEGVWDKGGEPSGVSLSEETSMADHDEKVPAWADALSKRFDALDTRLDAIEGKREDRKDAKDAKEEEKKDAKRKDEKEEKEEKKDAKRNDGEESGKKEEEKDKKELEEASAEEKKKERKDADEKEERADSVKRTSELQAQIKAMETRLAAATRMPTNDERDEIAKAYARADSLARMLADEVTHALPGENPISYRKRLAAKFQKFSATLKEVKLDSLDGAAFDHLENQIYADAQAAALSPEITSSGRLIPIYETNPQTGQRITRWAGDMDGWLSNFKRGGTTVSISRSHNKEHA